MIKGINSSGRYITVTGGSNSGPYISPGAAAAGMLRWNPNLNQMEVNDGNSWISMNMGYPTIEMTPEAESLLDWARQRRAEEAKMQDMIEKYPALKKAKENYDLIWNLIKDEHKDQI
jgi:hypothetical protein